MFRQLFHRLFGSSDIPENIMRVVVGLGNPGKRYKGTRHNVGFDVVDLLAKSPNAEAFREKFQAEAAPLTEDGVKILLVKPLTFMNLSGRPVRQFVDFYKIETQDVLVVCDDMNLPLGKLRFRAKGTHGGHNGLRDIQNHLGSNEYPRLRIGVDAPRDDAVDHVLGRFRSSERSLIDDSISLAAQAVAMWWKDGIEKCMNEYNG